MLQQIDWTTAKLAITSIGFFGISLADLGDALQAIASAVAIVAGGLAIAVSLQKLKRK